MERTAVIESAAVPLRDAVQRGHLPGFALGLIDGSGDREVVVDGWAQIEPERVAMTRTTMFDLASLTKPVFTTTAMLGLIANGQAQLDQSLGEIIPDLRPDDRTAPERRLTVRACLTHQTFLPAVEPFYLLRLAPAALEAYVLRRSWPTGPPVYSDINFLLLGIAVARLTGAPLREIPLRPGLTFDPDPDLCAATEFCRWRRRVLRGTVHDENAFAFGGVAGHAGLFGTIDGVLDFALEVLTDAPDPRHPLHPVLLGEPRERTLGWERSHPGWSGGDGCSEATIGHTGFTGTGLWIDPEGGVAWALLTNRIHPSREGASVLTDLRPEVGRRIAA